MKYGKAIDIYQPGDRIVVELLPEQNPDAVFVTVREAGVETVVMLTPARANKIAKALKLAAKEARK